MNRDEILAFGRMHMEHHKLYDALMAVRRRLHFNGHPQEPMWSPHGVPVPDWRKEIAIIEMALFGDASTSAKAVEPK